MILYERERIERQSGGESGRVYGGGYVKRVEVEQDSLSEGKSKEIVSVGKKLGGKQSRQEA